MSNTINSMHPGKAPNALANVFLLTTVFLLITAIATAICRYVRHRPSLIAAEKTLSSSKEQAYEELRSAIRQNDKTMNIHDMDRKALIAAKWFLIGLAFVAAILISNFH
jgi:Mg2+/Co2+ transporter CorB